MEYYYSVIKKKKILASVTTWMELKGIMLSKKSQTQKKITAIWFHICDLKKQMNEQNKIKKTEPGADTENKLILSERMEVKT